MKANEAQEKIWLGKYTQNLMLSDPNSDTYVEYVRKDTFIEKACDAYCKVCGHYPHTVPTYICRQACDYYKDFKKCMEDWLWSNH